MRHKKLSDEKILKGFRTGDAEIIWEYFYEYCQVAYYTFDKRYQLSGKENLDFMSLAHQYALYLIEHDWKPLEDRAPEVSLKTWLINGFRYVVLDALKWYRREYGSITFEDYLCSFDVTDNLRLQFNRIIEDLCKRVPMSRENRLIIELLLIQGFKGKEVAAKMGMTPAAVSQKYKRLKEEIIAPYFLKYYDMDLDMMEIMETEPSGLFESSITEEDYDDVDMYSSIYDSDTENKTVMPQKRTTPEFITELQPGEIFVFGSNLKGMHAGGAAYVAYRKFGAILGQGVGLQGQSYGIPTMQGGVDTIRPYVDDFIAFAKEHPELTFLVTRIGCGIAGFTDDEISPLFDKAHNIDNIILPEGW